MCIVVKQEKLKAKLNNCALPCIWLGYANSHAGDIHQVLIPTTCKVILTRTVAFMKILYFHKEKEVKEKELTTKMHGDNKISTKDKESTTEKSVVSDDESSNDEKEADDENSVA